MPQAPFSLQSYLGNTLPTLTSELPLGVGQKVPRPTWEGPLKGISVIDGFEGQVEEYLKKQLPVEPVSSHPEHHYPHLASASRALKLNSDAEVLQALKTLPLESTLAVLAAWDLYEHGHTSGEKDRIAPAVEADGHEITTGKVGERVAWKFGKSPMGETEFILVDDKAKPVLVVRAVSENVFSHHDWDEFSVNGPYRYNPKSKASWLWSRQVGGTTRLGVKFFVLTSYSKWAFGVFNDDGSFANVSPVISNDSKSPTVLAALTYWARSALGHPEGYTTVTTRDVSNLPQLFPSNPARRASHGKAQRDRPEKRTVVKLGNESDVEDSDVENQA